MPTPRTEVRTARAEEYGAIGELSASTYLAEGYADQSYAHVLRDVAGRAASATVLVALRDDRVIGSIAVAVAGGPFAEQAGPGEAVIRMLVTDPSARGAGAGTALVAAALDRAREAGCRLVRLSTQASMTAAHHVYEKAGFTRTPERDWSPVPGVDLLTYELPLAGWCRLCGRPGRHPACERALELEPPRYCAACGRRLVVQVLPTGWTARCSQHGVTAG